MHDPNSHAMKLLILTEYIRRTPTAVSAWAVEIARGMAARGYDVTVACDSLDDAGMLGGLPLVVHRPLRSHLGASPFQFQRWARWVKSGWRDGVCLSLTPLLPGDLWLPMGPRAWDTVRALVQTMKPVSAAMELVQLPWLPAARAAERIAVGEAGRYSVTRLSIGPAPRKLTTARLGYASRFDPPDPAAQADLRARTRQLLGINEHRSVILASVLHAERAGLVPFFQGVAQVRKERSHGLPVVLVAGRAGAGIERIVKQAGCLDAARFLGRTERIDALLAACDLAAAPLLQSASAQGSTGRFIADALRLGRPVIALRRTPGSELLQPEGPDPVGPGWIVEQSDVQGWILGLNTALSEDWLAHRTPVAKAAGASLSMDALITRLEHHVRERAHAKRLASG